MKRTSRLGSAVIAAAIGAAAAGAPAPAPSAPTAPPSLELAAPTQVRAPSTAPAPTAAHARSQAPQLLPSLGYPFSRRTDAIWIGRMRSGPNSNRAKWRRRR